jgi:hypothetical protein
MLICLIEIGMYQLDIECMLFVVLCWLSVLLHMVRIVPVRVVIVQILVYNPDNPLVLMMIVLFRLGTVCMLFVLVEIGTVRLCTTSMMTHRKQSSIDQQRRHDMKSNRAHPGTDQANTMDMIRNRKRGLQNQQRTTSTQLDLVMIGMYQVNKLSMLFVLFGTVMYRAHMMRRLFVLLCFDRNQLNRINMQPDQQQRSTLQLDMVHMMLVQAMTEMNPENMTSMIRNHSKVDIDQLGKQYMMISLVQRLRNQQYTVHITTFRVELELFQLDKQDSQRGLCRWQTVRLDKEYMPWRLSELRFVRGDMQHMMLVRTEPVLCRVDRADMMTSRCWESTNRERMTRTRQDQDWTNNHQVHMTRIRMNREEIDMYQ